VNAGNFWSSVERDAKENENFVDVADAINSFGLRLYIRHMANVVESMSIVSQRRPVHFYVVVISQQQNICLCRTSLVSILPRGLINPIRINKSGFMQSCNSKSVRLLDQRA
jgi:hypothetical protein